MELVPARWQFKAQHFDSVMLFKMGKFYEMFEMDAHVGSDVLGLTYMKVGQPPWTSLLWPFAGMLQPKVYPSLHLSREARLSIVMCIFTGVYLQARTCAPS